jgi:hypothetical protein
MVAQDPSLDPDYRNVVALVKDFFTNRHNALGDGRRVDFEEVVDMLAQIDGYLDPANVRQVLPIQLPPTLAKPVDAIAARRPFERAFFRSQAVKEITSFVTLAPGADVSYLDPIVRSKAAMIATLNYDESIETAAHDCAQRIDTGFDLWAESGALEFDPHATKLLKLHGSTSWYVTVAASASLGGAEERWHLYSRGDMAWDPMFRGMVQPVTTRGLIVGGGNKLTGRGPHPQLIAEFSRQLRNIDRLVIIGYSFRDRHVNDILARRLPSLVVIVDKAKASDVARSALSIWQVTEPGIYTMECGADESGTLAEAINGDRPGKWLGRP